MPRAPRWRLTGSPEARPSESRRWRSRGYCKSSCNRNGRGRARGPDRPRRVREWPGYLGFVPQCPKPRCPEACRCRTRRSNRRSGRCCAWCSARTEGFGGGRWRRSRFRRPARARQEHPHSERGQPEFPARLRSDRAASPGPVRKPDLRWSRMRWPTSTTGWCWCAAYVSPVPGALLPRAG